LEILVAYFEDTYIVRIVRKFKSQLYLTLKIAEKYTNAVFVVAKGLVNDMMLGIDILQVLSENINRQNKEIQLGINQKRLTINLHQ
jgi:hypothetical protein